MLFHSGTTIMQNRENAIFNPVFFGSTVNFLLFFKTFIYQKLIFDDFNPFSEYFFVLTICSILLYEPLNEILLVCRINQILLNLAFQINVEKIPNARRQYLSASECLLHFVIFLRICNMQQKLFIQ